MANEKNYDPQMHSAEHILNQVMVRKFGIPRSFSNHIEKKKSKCDYHFERSLTAGEEQEIADEVNLVVGMDLEVKTRFMNRSEAEALFDLSRLPEDAGDVLRIVEIGDFDSCPCIGPHVGSTKEIGAFRLLSTDFENGVLRIRFKIDRPV
jgi:Predicted metal-dependent hydrolases related to alanyl-tRNA synthetase HxxxH domain